ncbi:MAG: fibronectin type III domain-containing protein [Bacillota bacterium]
MVNVIPLAGAGMHQDNDPGIVYTGSSWYTYSDNRASGGSYKHNYTGGDTAYLAFEGRGIRWVGMTSTDGGQAEVVVRDAAGTPIKTSTVSMQSSAWTAQVELFRLMGLTRGQYSIELKNTSLSGNKTMWLDGLEVLDSDDDTPPAVPASLTAVAGDRVVALQWSSVTDESLYGYLIYRAEESADGTYSQINSNVISYKTTLVDSAVNNGTTYYYKVTTIDQAGNESAGSPVTPALPAMYPGRHEEWSAGMAYQGTWYDWGDSRHSAGNLKYASTVGNSVTAKVYGTGVRLIVTKRSDAGTTLVTLDGGTPEEVNMYNSSYQYQQNVYEKTGLANGLHTIKIEIKSGNTFFDAIEVIGTTEERGRVEEDNLSVEYKAVYSGVWDSWSSGSYSGGTMRGTRRTGAVASYTFYGTGVEWLTDTGYNRGIAKVTLDGGDPVLVDLYSSNWAYQVRVYKRQGLALGKHTLRVEVTGSKSPTSSDTWVGMDAFEVLSPVLTAPGAPTGLTAAAGAGSVTLNWTAPGEDAVSYRIYRYRGMLEDGVINLDLVRVESYTDGALVPGVEYTYKVSAIGALGNESELSAGSAATPLATGEGEPAPVGTPGAGLHQEDRLTYSGSWWDWWNGNHSGSNVKYGYYEGSTASFSFNGTGVKLLLYTDNGGRMAEIRVDGNLESRISPWSSGPQYQQLVFQKTQLPKGLHTIEIKLLKEGYFYIDALQVLESVDSTAGASPTGLAVSKGNTTAALQWDSNSETDLVGYRLYRSMTADSGYKAISSYPLQVIPKSVTSAVYYTDSGLLNGEKYYYTVTAVDESGNESLPAEVVNVIPLAGAGMHQDNDPGIVYTGSSWYTYNDAQFSGGSYKYSYTAYDAASLIFEGTGVRWISRYGPNFGQAEVFLDGDLVSTVDLNRSGYIYQAIAWQNPTPLEAGMHEVRIKNITNKTVELDAFEVVSVPDTTAPDSPVGLVVLRDGNDNYLQWLHVNDGELYGYNIYRSPSGEVGTYTRLNSDPLKSGTAYKETISTVPNYYFVTAVDRSTNESAPSAPVSETLAGSSNATVEEGSRFITYAGIWNTSNNGSASGGKEMLSTGTSVKATYKWFGSGIDLLARRYSSAGMIQVALDGDQPVIIDLYSYSAYYQQLVYRRHNLPLGWHTLEISPAGKNISSSGATVNIDAFRIINADLSVPLSPTEASATALVNKVQLSWQPPADQDVAGYNVYYRYGVYASQLANTAGLAQPGYVHTGLNLSTRYYYKVTAVDALNNESTVSEEVYAETTDSLIKAILMPSYEAIRGKAITFNAGHSYTADPPLTYKWDFNGDGAYDDASGIETSYTFNSAGQFTIGLRITDSFNRSHTTTAAVNVKVAVLGVTLDREFLKLPVDAKENLVATVVPNDAFNRVVTWASSNPAVATVNENGEVTGVSPGVAVITVTTEEGNYKATSTVSVVIPVTEVILNKSTTEIYLNETQQLTATIVPTNATNKAVNWSTSNPGIATVDENGLVTAVSPGTTDITVTTEDGNITAVATVTVWVDTTPPVVLGIEPANGTIMGPQASITVRGEDEKALTSIKLQYSVDGGTNWQNVGTINTTSNAIFQWATAPLNGGVLIRAIATDKAGNTSDGTPVRTYTVDNQGPAQVTGLTATPSTTSILLQWSDVPDPDFSYFRVEQRDVNGNFYSAGTTSTQLGLNVTGLSPLTAYAFRVVAYDIRGNRGTPSEEIQESTISDTTVPQVTGIYPQPGYFANGIPLLGTASDNVGVVEFTFQYSTDRVDWVNMITLPTLGGATVTAAFSWNVSELSEGTYYVRGVARDAAENESNTSSTANYVEYRVDHTAPSIPTGLSATTSASSVTISWAQNPEQDLASYRVYKAAEPDGLYTALGGPVSSLGYIDRSVDPISTYYYKVAAIDFAGNEGQPAMISAQTISDIEAPQVVSIAPVSNATLPANPTINILAGDNHRLAGINLEYQDGTSQWNIIGSKQLNTSSAVASFVWNTSGLTDGSYLLRAVATDASENQSVPATTTYNLNVDPPSAPEVTATPGGWRVDLTWISGNESDLAGFWVYRSTTGESYRRIASINKTETSFSDAPLSPGQTYYYVVEAVDIYGNVSRSAEVASESTSADPYPPTANAGDDHVVTVGTTVYFDGTFSKDNDSISSYLWDFGDGSTGEGTQPGHLYNATGTYTVTLTVYDPSGNVATDTALVTVRPPQQVGTLKVRVLDDSSGAGIAGASVVIQFADGTMQKTATDSQGLANVVADPGQYKVYAYKTDYKPAAADATVVLNQETTTTVRLASGQLVVGELTVRRMTLDEIVSAGIDVSAPENQWVYNFEVHLAFNNTLLPAVNYTVNGAGQFLASSWQPIVIPMSGGGSGGTMIAYPAAIPYENHPEVRPTIAYLVIPGEARWLKEFFEVGLTLENTADAQFVITDSTATLNLPTGLALAPTREPQSLQVDLGDIAGGETRQAKWIIRGDAKGSYTLEAVFNGALQPFNDPVQTIFRTSEPFRVWGDDALKMHVDAQGRADQGYPYHVRFGLENVSDVPVYNATIELKDQGKQNYIYAPNQELVKTIRELPPGQTLWAEYRLIPSLNGILDLSQSYTLKTGGDAAVPSVITSHSVPENIPGTAPVLNSQHNADGTVTLSWGPVVGATGYNIYTVRDDLLISTVSERVYMAGDGLNTLTLAEPGGAKDYVITTMMADGTEVLRHGVSGAYWYQEAGAPVITVNPAEVPSGVDTELWITVNANGLPVVGGTVDVGTYFMDQVLDANGQARVTIHPNAAGTITVTAYNPDKTWFVSIDLNVVHVGGPPVFSSTPTNTTQTINEGAGLTALEASDPDNDALVFNLESGSLPEGISLNNDGTFNGTASYGAAGFGVAGTYTAVISVSDIQGGTATTTLVVTVNNVDYTPTLGQVSHQSNIAGDAVHLTITGADADGDTLSYNATGLPPGLEINTVTGIVYGYISPTAGDGEYNVTITVTDNTPSGEGGTYTGADRASSTFIWSMTLLQAINDTTTTLEDTPVSIYVLENDVGTVSRPPTIAAVVQNPGHGTVNIINEFVTYTPDDPGASSEILIDNFILYTPEQNWYGTDTFTYRITDSLGRTATTTVTVTVTPVDDAPVMEPLGSLASPMGSWMELAIAVDDVDGDSLTFSASGLPVGLGIDPVTGIISGIIPNTSENSDLKITVTATDNTPSGAGGTFTEDDMASLTLTLALMPSLARVVDVNGDGTINTNDLQGLAGLYGQSGNGVNTVDANGDRIMDIFDLAILSRNMRR